MKGKHLFLACTVLLAGLMAVSCVGIGDGGDDDVTDLPNFVSDPCGGCKTVEYTSATVITFFSYVKNNGGDGTITITIDSGSGSSTMQFTVKAGASYVFQASVPVVASSTTSFTYQAVFAGSPGYTDSYSISGYHVTGAPFNLQMNLK